MANVKLGTKAVGSVLKLNLNGAPWDIRILHQGNPNPALYDSSCDGTWFAWRRSIPHGHGIAPTTTTKIRTSTAG